MSFTLDAHDIRTAASRLQHYCHGQAKHNGWWTDLATGRDLTSTGYPKVLPTVNVGEKLMLAVTELAEAMEGYRKHLMDDHLPDRTMLEVEMADCVIRIFDAAGGLGLDVSGAIAAKLEYNGSRADHKLANRMAVGGKKV